MFKLTIDCENGEMLHVEDCQHSLELAVNSNESFAVVHLDDEAAEDLFHFLQEQKMKRAGYDV